jgi:rhamnosyltransferase
VSQKCPKIAILLATYNGEKFITDQIESIITQKNVSFDLIISDDASTDGTKKIIESYVKQYPNIKFINYSRVGGPAKNFYFLIDYVDMNHYDFISLSDQDDIWKDSKLSRAINILKKNNASAYSSDVLAFKNNNTQDTFSIVKSQPQKKYDYFFETPGPGCSYVFTTELCKFIKDNLQYVYPNNFPYHDWFIYALARHNNYKWIIDDEKYLLYRQHGHNFIGANIGFISIIKRLDRILSGKYYIEVATLYNLLHKENKKLNYINIWFFILNFYHTRRKINHGLYMILFFIILLIQKK